jgi:small-conductance mechanosensitive channel
MWLNLLMDDRQCDKTSQNLNEKKKKRSHWLGTFLWRQFFQPSHKRENVATDSRLTWKAASTGWTSHGTGTPERDQWAAGLATYYTTCDYYWLSHRPSYLVQTLPNLQFQNKIDHGELFTHIGTFYLLKWGEGYYVTIYFKPKKLLDFNLETLV